MTDPTADDKFAQVAHQIDPDSTLLRAGPLTGGVSAQVTALEIALPGGGTRKLVVRQHGARDLAGNPQIAADEFRLLQGLHAAGLPVPLPYTFDQSGAIFATPYVVLEYIEGAPEFAPANLPDYLRQFAAQLACIHQITPAQVDLSFLPTQAKRHAATFSAHPATTAESVEEQQIRQALASVWPLPPLNAPVLLHGDFWPGNLLWREGQLVGVIDWEDAQVGDPVADLANSRLEILWAFGSDAMHQFTRLYQSLTTLDCTHLPYWDLYASWRPTTQLAAWATSPAEEQAMRAALRQFIAQALDQLADQDG